MKRKYLAFVCCIGLILALLAIPCAAAETPGEENLTEADVSVEETNWDDFFARIFEFSGDHRSEIINIVGSVVLALIAAVFENRRKKDSDDAKEKLNSVVGSSSNTETSQVSVVDAMNKMITGYNGMRDSYEKYEGVEDDRNRLIGAVLVQNTALLEILSSVYLNNKNLPQGVKDLVTLRYANAQKALGDDEMLLAIVNAVRETVNHEDVPTEETEETEELEV